jgi:predicted DNA-binding transcriptional regulator AlpA
MKQKLRQKEVEKAFSIDCKYPPILSLEQASELVFLAQSTLKRLVSEGNFANSVKRGKPIMFWRDRFVIEVMELDKTRKRIKNSKAQKKRKEVSRNEAD